MFYEQTLRTLLAAQKISLDMRVLVVCGSTLDKEVFERLDFRHVVISNIKPFGGDEFAPFEWSYRDAEELGYENSSFDLVVVHAGLHHCYSPHKAFLEMYRVARRVVLVLESRDSLLMRAGVKLRLTTDYELESVFHDGRGGVHDSDTPNFVYRWTEEEVRKTIKSYAPEYQEESEFFYGLELPYEALRTTGQRVKYIVVCVLTPLAWVFSKVFSRQCNRFAFAVYKTGRLQPWLKCEKGRISPNKEYKHGFEFSGSANSTPEPKALPKTTRST